MIPIGYSYCYKLVIHSNTLGCLGWYFSPWVVPHVNTFEKNGHGETSKCLGEVKRHWWLAPQKTLNALLVIGSKTDGSKWLGSQFPNGPIAWCSLKIRICSWQFPFKTFKLQLIGNLPCKVVQVVIWQFPIRLRSWPWPYQTVAKHTISGCQDATSIWSQDPRD